LQYQHPHTVIIICGPTASGKTALSIQLAQHYNTAIISADSRQCYRELNIGVAKPSVAELAAVQHYFINSHSIQEEVNAGTYEQYALEAANTIFQHQPIAIMVGGTGLYIKAFTEGMDAMPSIPTAIRQQVTQQYHQYGLSWLQQQVQQKDPAFWQVAEQQNPQRLMRALEMIEATGISITAYRTQQKTIRPFRTIKIALDLPREQLYHNINTRVDLMMKEGLEEEVQQLLPWQQLNALQTVGYKELFAYMNQEYTLPEAVERIKTNTRQYAKRQLTWFKREEAIQWMQPGPGLFIQATGYINSLL